MAILMVMGGHLFVLRPATPSEQSFADLAALGAHGVDLFFCLSGFLITGILLDGKGTRYHLRNFYARRTLRIFPLYYALLAFSFILLPWLLRLYPPAAAKLSRFSAADGDWVWYVTYLSNFAIALADKYRHGVLDVTWSLAIEEQFYLVWPAVVLFTGRRTLQKICVGVIIAAFVCRVTAWQTALSPLQIYVLTPCRMDALACGAFAAAWIRGPVANPLRVAAYAQPFAVVGTSTVIVLGLLGLFGWESPAVYTFGYSAVSFIATAWLVAAVAARCGTPLYRLLTAAPLRLFGKYSYALYLFHLPIRAVVRDVYFGDAQFRSMPGHPLCWQAVFYIVATLPAVALAALSWYAFERPILSLKKYLTAAGEPANPVESPPRFECQTFRPGQLTK